ncbi:MAG: hypothetical protein HY540_05920 [Deltaproteobacteria bacterium]|nr:hypothetical protein [Deltaproteobacteria bacterium]
MNGKRFWLSVVAVFVVIHLLEYVLHQILLMDVYMATAHLWRPEADMAKNLPMIFAAQIFLSFMFCFIFTKGYENRGVSEGIRYGFLIALLMIPTNVIMYAVQPMPMSLPIIWSLWGILEGVIAGAVLAKVYRKSESCCCSC